MCLGEVDKVTKKGRGYGYKVVWDKGDGYYSWDYPETAGKIKYPIEEWLKDEARGTIGFLKYPTGFHFATSLKTAKFIAKENTKDYRKLKVLKCKVDDVVATGQNYPYGNIIVARKIYICKGEL